MDVSRLLLPDLEEVLRDAPDQVREILAELHPADTAELLSHVTDEQQAQVIPYLPDDQVAEVLDHLGPDRRAPVFARLPPEAQVRIAENMSADDRADMFAKLAPEVRDAVLARMPKEEAKDVRELMSFPPNTAGSLMTTDIVDIPHDLTVGEVLERVRQMAEEMETVTYVYLTDRGTGKLMGVLSLRELVVNKSTRPAAEVMNDNVVTVGPLDDQEEVARLISKYGFIALPVVDENQRLQGIVTVDDLVNVVVQEGTEDIQKMGGMQAFDAPYFATPFWSLFRKRAGWLVVLLLGQMLTITALKHYDGALRSVDALIWFIPMIISSGGNSGSQTATLLVRGLAVGEIQLRDAWRLLVREFGMGLSLGVLLGVLGVVRVMLVLNDLSVALAVGTSLIGVVLFGCLTATAMPLLLRRLGLDPAVSSAPFIASLVDVTGIIIYVNVAIWIVSNVVP